jgi:hypothetical protein
LLAALEPGQQALIHTETARKTYGI